MWFSTLMPMLDKNHSGKVDRFCDLALISRVDSKIFKEGGLKLLGPVPLPWGWGGVSPLSFIKVTQNILTGVFLILNCHHLKTKTQNRKIGSNK